MPYIHENVRNEIRKQQIGKFEEARTAGELNFAISTLVLGFLGDNPNYSRYNEAIGALEAAKLEFYRKAVTPYENKKIMENGDLYAS